MKAAPPAAPEKTKRPRNAKPDNLTPLQEAAWAEKRIDQIGKRYLDKFDAIEKEWQLEISAIRSSLTVEALKHLEVPAQSSS